MQQMKRQKKLQKQFQKREKFIPVLDDFGMICALMILLMTLIFLMDIMQYEWTLIIILIMGILLDFSLALSVFLRKHTLLCMIFLTAAMALMGILIYFVAV